ncbi:protein lethal, putative [Pediculus humanus corporis]|uniref:Protein lethal, putative n=1 Tax=Pediculus humanus subsp. corporis TaxID=121224 RepID=E0VQ24_PEDHC|nr:protein lethal, putative [Pediculus humanus corporis]EEB15480.1 protein lethal, putative [Pediculus humanus corporis]
MSLVPLLYRDWWDDFDRPMKLFDQNFGLGLRRDDLVSSLFNSPMLRSGYLRPWRELSRQSSGSSTVQSDKDKFQVILDVQQFAPSEIVVKTQNNVVLVEGKHEEKQDEHGFISRHFVRKYVLPSDIEVSNITSSLSSDGVLTISAPKKTTPAVAGERVVPINQTGRPAVKQAPSTPTSETPTSESAPVK